jgi:hypothetical protein
MTIEMKLITALCERLGLKAEVIKTKKGKPYNSYGLSPWKVDVSEFEDGKWYEYNTECKLTEMDVKVDPVTPDISSLAVIAPSPLAQFQAGYEYQLSLSTKEIDHDK